MLYLNLLEKVKQLAKETAKRTDLGHVHSVIQKGKQDFVTDVDLDISTYLCKELPLLLPGSRVISEEDFKGEPETGYYWVIDPIDGTNNFIYRIPNFAISIGLLEDRKPVLGVIYAPKLDEMYSAAIGQGAFCNEQCIRVCSDETVSQTLITAETNPYSDRSTNLFPAVLNNINQDCIDYRIAGSAALDCCYVACGRVGAFIAENVKPWDYTAGEIIVKEAGGTVSQWNGEPMTYYGNTSILMTNSKLHYELLNRIQGVLGDKIDVI